MYILRKTNPKDFSPNEISQTRAPQVLRQTLDLENYVHKKISSIPCGGLGSWTYTSSFHMASSSPMLISSNVTNQSFSWARSSTFLVHVREIFAKERRARGFVESCRCSCLLDRPFRCNCSVRVVVARDWTSGR